MRDLDALLGAATGRDRKHLVRQVLGDAGACWQLFLSPAPAQRVLDADSTYSSAFTLAHGFDDVVALVTDGAVLELCRARAASEGVRNVSWLHGSGTPDLPFAAATFDAVLLNGGLEYVPNGPGLGATEFQLARLREIARVLKPGGRCCVVAANRFALDAVPAPRGARDTWRWSGFLPGQGRWPMRRAETGAGVIRRAHSVDGYRRLAQDARLDVLDVVAPWPHPHDVSRLAGVSGGGPLWGVPVPKRLVSPSWAAHPWLLSRVAPAVAIVASNGSPATPSLLEVVLADAAARYPGAAPWTVRECLVSEPEKLTLLLAPRAGSPLSGFREGLVAKLPGSPRARERMDRCADTLHAIAGEPALAEIAALAPRSLGTSGPAGRPWFLEDMVPGRPGEGSGRSAPEQDRLIADATRLLTVLHTRTATTVPLDVENVHQLFTGPLEEVAAFLGRRPGDDAIARLAGALRAAVEGGALPVVWTHGDYSLKNVLGDAAGTRVVGIIDWDLSRRRGLPLLDLLHLLVRVAMGRHRESWSTVVRTRLFRGQVDGPAGAGVGEYCRTLGLPSALRQPLAVAYWLDRLRGHVGTSKHLDTDWGRQNFHALVEPAIDALGPCLAPATTPGQSLR